jgi:deazaflavin-dependent oxidoreductase (nitroreductase family)
MDDSIRGALDQGQLIDITTTGRRSGEPRRIEIVFHNFGGRIYISGMPRHQKRAWIANLEADPELTVHLKGVVRADLPATARIVDDETERRQIMPLVASVWRRTDIDEMVGWSPLIEVIIPGYGAAAAA